MLNPMWSMFAWRKPEVTIAPPLAVGDPHSGTRGMLPNRAPFTYRLPLGDPEMRERPTALGQEHDHVDGDQGVGDDRAAGGLAQAHDFRALGGALRAAHPHRGAGHAVGADGAPAVRAGDAGLA